jgi:hypothetical protein
VLWLQTDARNSSGAKACEELRGTTACAVRAGAAGPAAPLSTAVGEMSPSAIAQAARYDDTTRPRWRGTAAPAGAADLLRR